MQGILEGAINPSLTSVVEHIRKGTLDFVLLKPADAQFLVSTARFHPWRAINVVTALVPNPKPDTTIILSTRGNRRRAVRVGWFDFKVNGTPCRLEAERLLEPGVGENDLGLFFTDATTKKESYGVGRYLDPERRKDGLYTLDFNRCYNPACAYSDHYNCPIPPEANHLTVAIRAGEMDSHYMH